MYMSKTIEIQPYITDFASGLIKERPTFAEGKKLYYNRNFAFSKRRPEVFDPTNMELGFRLWKWSKSKHYTDEVGKVDFVHLFEDNPRITKRRIGSFLTHVLKYNPSIKKNPTGKFKHPETGVVYWYRASENYWRFNSRFDIQYACEYYIFSWLPWARHIIDGAPTVRNVNVFEEELGALDYMSLSEFREMYIDELVQKGLKPY